MAASSIATAAGPPDGPAFPGPSALGRGVVVRADAPTPTGFEQAPRVPVDEEALAQPDEATAALHRHWLARQPVVVELAVDPAALREPEVVAAPLHRIAVDEPAGVLPRERLGFLVWANNWDLRDGTPIWWHGVLAVRRAGALPLDAGGGPGDVRLPDGTAVWVDGGPRGPLTPSSSGLAAPAAPSDGGVALIDGLPLTHRESVALGRLTLHGAGVPAVDGLAPDQHAAVAHASGPARVIAPAGSGKTRVLTARLRHLLLDRRVEPELVTAVAYNTRAADELRARTDGLGASIRTLHSLALWICTLDRRREVIQERDVRGILGRLLRLGRVPNQDPWQPYLDALSETRLALRDPAEVELVRGDVDGFAELFERYRHELASRDLLDFDEQVYVALELLLSRPDIRRRAQRAGTHLLVDEVQDLTPAFVLLLRLVAGPSMQVFAVGDDDQTIYSFAGASPRYLVDVDRWLPGAAHHALEVNYRCPAPVVQAAANLLSHNRVRVPKDIRSAAQPGASHAADAGATAGTLPDEGPAEATGTRSGEGAGASGAPPRIHTAGAGDMAALTVGLVRERLDRGVAPSAIAVLGRVVSCLLPVQVALADAGIATTAPLDATVLQRTGIRATLAYLRLGLDPERIRRDDVLETINRPARKVKSAVAGLLTRGTLDLRDLAGIVGRLDGAHRERFASYVADLRLLASSIADGADTAACLHLVRARIGLGEAMDDLDASRRSPQGSSHGDDLDALAQLAPLHPDPATFQDWLAGRLRRDSDPAGVTLSTVHRVKGREWDDVVVFAATAGLFPHRLAEDREEERRVFHVAITRCRNQLDIVADRERPSPFVAELLAPAPPRSAARPGAAETPTFPAKAAARAGSRHIPAAGGPDDVADEALFEALRAWRARTASDAGVPAYLVFHDRHLRAIAARAPGTMRELATCPGVGPTKLERYGADVLEIVDAHVRATARPT